MGKVTAVSMRSEFQIPGREGVSAALAALVVVLAEVPVQRLGIGGGEVAFDTLFCHPGVQVPGRADVGADRCFFVRAALAVGLSPEVLLELGDRRAPVTGRDGRPAVGVGWSRGE